MSHSFVKMLKSLDPKLFLEHASQKKKEGMSESDIAKSLGLSVVDFRLLRAIALCLKKSDISEEKEGE